MGSPTPRKRKDGSIGYMAQVRVKQKGKVVHSETKTFDRNRQQAHGKHAGKPNCGNLEL
jgi:hypothetical protein